MTARKLGQVEAERSTQIMSAEGTVVFKGLEQAPASQTQECHDSILLSPFTPDLGGGRRGKACLG